jgi:uncharacterized repeat protein (TIGR03803 family)
MKINTLHRLPVVILFALGFTLRLHAQLVTAQHCFTNSPDGANPGTLVLAGGALYGTTANGGTSNFGLAFRLGADGTGYSVLYNFSGGTNGATPNDLLLTGDTLFGTTSAGGKSGYGSVFYLGTNGIGCTTIYNFTNLPDAEYPLGGLILGGGTLYGTTAAGGSSGSGTVFKLNTNGTGYAVLRSFTNTPDGATPRAGLVLNGATLYGTTEYGGTYGNGTVFKLNTNGTGYTIIYNFSNAPDAQYPCAGLVISSNQLYGTASYGGSHSGGAIFTLNTNGTSYSVLHHFTGPTSPAANSDGAYPKTGLLLNGTQLYGATVAGGSGRYGTVFQLGTNGSDFLILKNFTNAPDGVNPQGGLVLNSNTLWGTTYLGGAGGNGMAFSLLLSPAITLQPASLTVTNGNPAACTVAATGAGQLNYQWYYQSNAAIVGATNNILYFTNAITNLVGSYLAVITNLYGSATSSPASLVVVTAPNLFAFTYNPAGGSFSLSMANVAKSTNRLWASTNLAAPDSWRILATNVMATNGLWFFTDTNSIGKSTCFYRLSVP